MVQKILYKDDIEDYVFPQLKALEALFFGLKLKNTSIAFDFFKSILKIELEESYKKSPKKNVNR